jgi:hypothetical protein
MTGMRLHPSHGLDGRCTGADHGDAIVVPLRLAIVVRPSCRVDNAAFEAIMESRRIWPLQESDMDQRTWLVAHLWITQNPTCIQQYMAMVVELFRFLSWLLSPEAYPPLPFLFVPTGFNDLCSELHVLS